MTPPRVTLTDIAASGGWSVSTVSYALRNSPKISRETRAAIQAAAEELGYHPDPAMSALAAYRTSKRTAAHHGNLAFITSWGNPQTWNDPGGILAGCDSLNLILDGARERAVQLGYDLEHFTLPPNDAAAARQLDRVLLARGIRGVIAVPYPKLISDFCLEWKDLAVVAVYSEASRAHFSFVQSDNYGAMRTAMLKVVERGYRRPGLLVHRDIVEASDNQWAAGFLSKEAAFPEIGPDPIFSPDHLIRERLLRPLQEWIERNRLDVVICGSDAWLLPWLEELGYRVPEDLGLCCLDLIKPDGRVSGFDQHPRQLGRSAATILNSLLLTSEFGPLEFPTSTHLAAQWVEGTTLPLRPLVTEE